MSEYCNGCKERQDRIDELERAFSDSLDEPVGCEHVYGINEHEQGYDLLKNETDKPWPLGELFDFCPKCGDRLRAPNEKQ